MHAVPGLACPACRAELRADGEATLTCDTCGASYPVLDGIPSFSPAPPGGRPSRHELTVLIPAVNQADQLDRLLPVLRYELEALEISHELIVVDQGSTDGTEAIVGRHGALLVRQTKPGYGAGLRRGFDRALGEYILTLDADGSHDPSFLKAMWAARTGVEVVIASRYIEGAGAEMPPARQALSQLLNRVLRRGLSLPYSDLSSGYRLYRRAAVEALSLQATSFDILQEILIRMVAAGYSVREVPFRYRALGTSRAWLARFALSHLKTFGAMWKLRNSIASADYDARAYDSVIPLQRYWQRRRYQVITTMAAGARRVARRRLRIEPHHRLRPAGRARHRSRQAATRGVMAIRSFMARSSSCPSRTPRSIASSVRR